jgi:hypothetical protein
VENVGRCPGMKKSKESGTFQRRVIVIWTPQNRNGLDDDERAEWRIERLEFCRSMYYEKTRPLTDAV